MAGPILTGNHPKALWPGVRAFWGIGYDEHTPEECKVLFETYASGQNYEEDVQTSAFGLAPVKPESNPISYASHTQGYVSRYTHVSYALGFMVSEEEIDDNLYPKLANSRAESLGFAMRQTKENVGANVYNRAFNTSYTGGDGQVLIGTAHPSAVGSQSNALSPAQDLSEASIEDMLIQIMGAEDHKGNKIALMGESIHLPRQLWFEAGRILKSVLQNNTANNAVNVLRQTGVFPKGIHVNHYFSDIDAWFVRTNVPHGMKHFQRKRVPLRKDNDFNTFNALAASSDRYSFGWTDFRGLYGSAGV